MLEVGEDGRDEKLDDLRLIEATEETEGDAANVLVGVLEVVAEVLAYQRELCLKRVNEENGMWEQNVGGAAWSTDKKKVTGSAVNFDKTTNSR